MLSQPLQSRFQIQKELASLHWSQLFLAYDTHKQAQVWLQIIDKRYLKQDFYRFSIRVNLIKNALKYFDENFYIPIQEIIFETSLNECVIVKKIPAYNLIVLSQANIWDIVSTSDAKLAHYCSQYLKSLFSLQQKWHKHLPHIRNIFPFVADYVWICTATENPTLFFDYYIDEFLIWGDEKEGDTLKNLELIHSSGEDVSLKQFYTFLSYTENYSENTLFYQFSLWIYWNLQQKIYTPSSPLISDCHPHLSKAWDELVKIGQSSVYKDKNSSETNFAFFYNHLKNLNPPKESSSVVENGTYQEAHKLAFVELQSKVEIGSSNGSALESPPFKVALGSFYIDIHPITCKEIEECFPSYQRSTYSSEDDSPATLVTLQMAQEYCDWRSKKEGLPVGSYRLPTEYEWEAAVRGTSGAQYPWDNSEMQTYIRAGLGAISGTMPISADKNPGRFGIYGMLGNIWEWTSSVMNLHPFSKEKFVYDPNRYVIKGGCWNTPKEQCRGSLRHSALYYEKKGNIGFRCVFVKVQ